MSGEFIGGVATGLGRASVSLVLPNQRALVGATLYTQATLIDKNANAAGLTTSDAAKVVIGG